MKNNKKNFKLLAIITFVVITLGYLASAIFTLGTVFAPETALKTMSINADRTQTVNNSFVTIDIDLTKPDDENPEETTVSAISKIFVYVGEVRSFAKDEKGNAYVDLIFMFKTKSANDATAVYEEINARIPVIESSGGFAWIKVFDGEIDKTYEEISKSRVKISTPDSIDIYEVVFTDKTGYVFDTDATFGTEEQISEAKLLIDEPNMFKYSNSKKYHFTNQELKTLSAVNALKGGKAAIGDGPLSTIIYFVGTSIFGTNTFGLRFFDFLAGVGILILAYAFATNLFEKEKYGLMTMLAVLSLGAVFTASNFAFSSIGAFFAVLSIYLSSRYFIRHYYLEDKTEGVICLLGVGLFYGLAVTANVAYSLTVIGHIVLFAMARKRAYKQYKKDEKEAVGLQKEDVFLAYRTKKLTSLGVMAIALLVIPTVLYLGAYSICASVYKNYFGAGFISSALKSFTNGLKPSYQSFPLALFAGFGGVELSSSLSSLNYGEMTTYYSFLNYFTCIFALACFVFVTFVAFFGKKVTFFKNVKTIKNKYKITTVAFLSLCLPVFLGLTSSPYGFAGASVFMCVYVAFAYSILARCLKIKVVNVIFSCATIVGLVAFGMAYVGYIGLALPEIAKSILYSWQVL